MTVTRGVSTTTMATNHIAGEERVEEIARTAATGVAEVVTAAMEEGGSTIPMHMAITMEEGVVTGAIAAVEVKGEVTAAMEEGEDITPMATIMEVVVVAGVTAAAVENEGVIVAMGGEGEEGGSTTITTHTEREEVIEVTAVSGEDHKNSSRLNSSHMQTMNTMILHIL